VDNPGAIFGILGLLVGLLATAGYGLMSVAQYRAARVAFSATALFFSAIGIELGLVMAWPLSAKIIVAGCFGFAAAGALVYAFQSVSFLEKLKVETTPTPTTPAKPESYIIADCFETDYPKEYPTNGMMYVMVKAGISAQLATMAGSPGQPLVRPQRFYRIARCDLSVHGDLPLFNVTMIFKLSINEFFVEKQDTGYRGRSGKFIETKEAPINIRKIDVYPASFTIYFEDRGGFWTTIDPPSFASSVSSLRSGGGYNVEVRRTNNLQLSIFPVMPDPEPPKQ